MVSSFHTNPHSSTLVRVGMSPGLLSGNIASGSANPVISILIHRGFTETALIKLDRHQPTEGSLFPLIPPVACHISTKPFSEWSFALTESRLDSE